MISSQFPLGFFIGFGCGAIFYFLLQRYIFARQNPGMPAPAKGEQLDRLGAIYGIERMKRESDKKYHKRLLDSTKTPGRMNI